MILVFSNLALTKEEDHSTETIGTFIKASAIDAKWIGYSTIEWLNQKPCSYLTGENRTFDLVILYAASFEVTQIEASHFPTYLCIKAMLAKLEMTEEKSIHLT